MEYWTNMDERQRMRNSQSEQGKNNLIQIKIKKFRFFVVFWVKNE